MSDELPEDIKRIITAQTQRTLPTTVTLPVLPKIGQTFTGTSLFGQSSSAPLPRTSSEMRTTLPYVRTSEIHERFQSPVVRRQGRSGNIPHFDYSHIPDHELLRSTQSTAHAQSGGLLTADPLITELDRTFVIRREEPPPSLPSDDSISVLDLTLAPIPTTLPVIPGLQTAVDNLSNRRVQSILDACRLYDREQRGYLSVPSMIKCIGEVVTSVHSADSPWRLLLNSMAPKGEFIEYKRLFALIQKARQPEISEETIPELLSPLHLDEAEFSLTPSPGQESRERCRAQVMTEIEVLLMRNPELSLDRLKSATTQKVIELSEFKMLLEMYGLEEPFRPFYKRLVSCFLTHDNKIHFSAFLGCLSLVRPPIRRPTPTAPSAPWNKAPLADYNEA